MKRDHVLGMICGYYLSRYDSDAYAHLGFLTQQATHVALGAALGVPAESIKNWRDEFDPVHDNARRGWWNREMYPSRRRVIEALGHLTEPELLALVRHVAGSPTGPVADDVVAAVTDSNDDGADTDDTGTFSLRGPTGIRAEEAFRAYHQLHGEPTPGVLHDRRHDQCGFDFEIAGEAGNVYVEVKGLAGRTGGVTFTNYEWFTANMHGESYYLALVRDVATTPRITLIRNPAARFDPAMRTYTIVQIGWSLSGAILRALEEGQAG
jgi:hypothetical protein